MCDENDPHIRCHMCGTTILSFRYAGMELIGRDDCPRCGREEFAPADGDKVAPPEVSD